MISWVLGRSQQKQRRLLCLCSILVTSSCFFKMCKLPTFKEPLKIYERHKHVGEPADFDQPMMWIVFSFSLFWASCLSLVYYCLPVVPQKQQKQQQHNLVFANRNVSVHFYSQWVSEVIFTSNILADSEGSGTGLNWGHSIHLFWVCNFWITHPPPCLWWHCIKNS